MRPSPSSDAPSGWALALGCLFALLGASRLGAAAEEPGGHPLPSLEAFLGAARASAPELREARARAAQREAEAEVATARLFPVLGASAGYTRNQYEIAASVPDGHGGLKEAVITPKDQLDATFTAELPLLDLSTLARRGAARDEARASQAESHQTEEALAQRVARAYYARLAGDGLIRAAQRAVEAAEANLARSQARLSSGLGSELEVARARAELPRQQQAVVEAQLAREQAARRLEAWTGLEARGEAKPDAGTTMETGAPEEPRSTWKAGLEALPSVSAAEAHARAAAGLRDAASYALVPTVSATGRERITNAVGFGKSPLWAAGVTASWRLDLGLLPALKAQRAAAEQGVASAERARRDASEAIDEAYDAVEAARARLAAAQLREQAARRAVEVARARWTAGTSTQLDLIEAERDAFAAEANRIQQEADLAYGRFALRLSSGRLSTLQAGYTP